MPLGINDAELQHGGRTIVVDKIDFCKRRRFEHLLLWSFIVTKHTGVHQHGPRGWCIEPSQIEHWFWFASPHKPPLSIGPSLHPRMVIIGMCPTRCIYLTGRDANGAQSCHREGAFFSTTAIGRFHGCQRRGGTSIRRLVSDVFMTPVIHLQDGLLHAESFDTLLQFVVIECTEIIQILIVDTKRQDEMAENEFGDSDSPRYLFTRLESCAHII